MVQAFIDVRQVQHRQQEAGAAQSASVDAHDVIAVGAHQAQQHEHAQRYVTSHV